MIVGLAGIALLYVLAAASDGDLAKVATALWYKDKFRLFSLLAMLTVPLVAVGTSSLSIGIRRALGRPISTLMAVTASVVALALALAGSSIWQVGADIKGAYAIDDNGMIDSDELDLLKEIPEVVPRGSIIAGNPWNGAALTWSVSGREALFPHLGGVWDSDRLVVAAGLDRAGTDPAVCEALDRLRVHYLYYSPTMLWGGNDPQAVGYESMDKAAGGPGLTEVLRSGTARLYRIDSCG
jgi:hypothetical protein